MKSPNSHNKRQDHDGMGHQRQSTSWLAPLGSRRSTAKNAHFQARQNTLLKHKNKHAYHKVGTFNAQGLLSETKQMLLADDFHNYKMKAIMVQETHMKGQGILDIKSSKGKTARLYYSGHSSKSNHGVGILVAPETQCEFFPISERIIMLKIKNEKIHINLISSYGPTSEQTRRKPEGTVKFYNNLSSIINKTKLKEVLIIGGDFNAKVKQEQKTSKAIGKYAKSKINENGELMLEFAELQNLKLTNTFFRHKPAHMSTWQCPQRQVIDSNSMTIRRNPYRNQIDFILIRNTNNIEVLDSRSYGGFSCNSDHKPVIAKVKIAWKHYKKTDRKQTINSRALKQDERTKQQYQNLVKTKLEKCRPPTNIQEKWNNIVECTKQAAIETIGYKGKKKSSNQQIRKLSSEQRSILQEINSTKCMTKKRNLKQKRNKVLNEIHKEIKQQKNEEIKQCMEPIENSHTHPNKTYEAIKQLKRMKPKKDLVIKTKNGMTANEEKQTELITEYFQKQFYKDAEKIPIINPCPMRTPFTAEETQKAANKMKDGTSPGVEGTTTEMIKYGPPEVFEEISNILNEIAETGTSPKEQTQGLITPLQKPGKPKGPISNLRPITLLSTLRKLLAICLCNRTNDRIDQEIPIQQAAYRKGRSTTEHVFATKLIIERIMSTENEKVHLLLLDMSKAFDTIKRKTLILELQKILEPDEIHLYAKLLDVELAVKCGNTIGHFFDTDTGGPQGDCSSAKNFTLYLAKTLENEAADRPTRNTDEISLEQLYADDISELDSNKMKIEEKLKTLPQILSKNGLLVNDDKTEIYEISRTQDATWKKCKLLGTLLDTTEDIKRRKGLAIDAIKTLQHIFKNKNIWTSSKSQAFDAYVSSVFLYNACTWTLTATDEEKIDAFQRKILRINVLNITWPKKISNENVYKIAKVKPWSQKIKKQKLTWFGHLMRMHKDVPARKALAFAQQFYHRSRGRPKTTWIKSFEKILTDEMNLTWNEAEEKAQDRKTWKQLIYQHFP